MLSSLGQNIEKHRSAYAFLLILSMSLSISQALAQGAESNYQFAARIFQQITRRAVAQLDGVSDMPVLVVHRSLEQETSERLLYQKLIEVLQSGKPRTIFTNADSTALAARIDFKLVQFELTYRQLPAGWFRTGKVRRTARAAADFDMQQARSGAVYFQGLIAETLADTLEAAQVPRLETPGLAFTVGIWEEQSTGRKLWEPLLLTAATGAVIYALYSLRSK